MFDFDAGKLVVIGIVALAVIPPKDLPRVLRTVGKYMGQMRRMASDFQGQFMDAMKDAELDNVKKEIASINEAARIDSFDAASLMRETKPVLTETPEPIESIVADPPVVAETLPEPLPATLEKASEKAASSAT